MMKQMNIGVSNFKDFPNNIDERIIELDSIIENIIAKLRRSHEENLRSLNAEIQAEETIQKQKDAFNKSNLNTIDLEIKKREEEGKSFSKSLKSKMEQQSQFNKQLEKINSIINTHNEHLQDYQSQSKKKNFVPTTNFLHNISNYETVFKDLQNFAKQISQQDFITDEQLQRFEELKKECKEAYGVLENMKSSDKGANFVSIQKLIDRICSDLKKNTKYSTEAKQKIEEYLQVLNSGNVSDTTFNEILAGWLKITNAEKLAGRAGKSFFDILNDGRVHQIAAQIAGMFSFYDVINIGKQAVSTVIDLNTQITELAKVSEQSGRQIYADFDSYADIAKEVRGTISDTISATADWSKNGYNIPDAKQLAEVSQLYRNVGDGIDIDSANESLISTLKGFQLEADQAEHIVDVFNEVSNNEAISSAGIGNALQRSAASFNAANTSLEKSVSLVTATNSILQDPEKVGNMWRTVSARLRGSKTELIEMGEDTEGIIESKSKLQSLVKGITGFDIMKDKDTYKDIYDIVLGIGEKWQDISDIDRASLLEALAGKQQSNALAAALSNIDILKKSYEEATHAEGSAREENEEYAKSIQASIDLTKAKLEELANDVLNSDFLKGAIDAGGKLIDILDGIAKSGNTIPAVFAGVSAVLSARKNIGKCTQVCMFQQLFFV